MSWKDPYGQILKEEKNQKDYETGHSDALYNLRYNACITMLDETAAYRKGFKDAIGYTPAEWRNL